MSGVYSTHEGGEKCLRDLKKRDPLENLGTDGRIKLTPYSRVLQTLILYQLAMKLPALYENPYVHLLFRNSSPLVTVLNRFNPVRIIDDPVNIIFLSRPGSSKLRLSLRFFSPIFCMHLFSQPYVTLVQPISFFLI